MLELVKSCLTHQYGASLEMLRKCIEQCTAEHWRSPVGRYPFWHVAYHVLFYTDLYLSPDDKSFQPRPIHRENYNFFGQSPRNPDETFVADQPYEPATLIQYTQFCTNRSAQGIDSETEASLAGPSGFYWLPFERLGLHFYNIRHIQHHTGQLSAMLNRTQGKAVGWVRSHVPE